MSYFMYCDFYAIRYNTIKFLYTNVFYHIESFSANKILNNVEINEINLIFQKAHMTSYEPLAYFHLIKF